MKSSSLSKKNNSGLYRYESYSLEGEDVLLNRYFKGKEVGTYIDVGAHHPYRFNNTYFFYKRGWKGINIDADKNAIDLFNTHRQKDINIWSAVGQSTSKKVYYQFNEPALNTFDKSLCTKYIKLGYKLTGKDKLSFRRLSDILKENMYNKQHVDFISIDVEGAELTVLKSNDWNIIRPEIILIEVLDLPDLVSASSHSVTKYLKEKGYKLIAKTLTNLLYKNDR